MMDLENIFYAFLAGVLPALIWLYFWLREDQHPEPKRLIRKTFIFGMIAVLAVLPFQKGVDMVLPGMVVPALFWWALLEELFKLVAGYFGGLHSVEDNEPIDPIIYMITAALGFVALENTLFILGPLVGEDIPRSIITGNLRFIGASLLHVISSGIIGFALAFTFYKPLHVRLTALLFAFVAAVIFHTSFNVLILKLGDAGTMISFLSVWVGAILVLLAFEKIKTLRNRQSRL